MFFLEQILQQNCPHQNNKQGSILFVVVKLDESGWFEQAVPSVHVYWNILHTCNKFIPHPNVKDIKMGYHSSNQGSSWRFECFGLKFFLNYVLCFIIRIPLSKDMNFFRNFSNISLSSAKVMRPSKLLEVLKYV